MNAKVKVTNIGYPAAGTIVKVLGEIKPTGMNAGGFKMLRVRDGRGREYTMNSHNLQLDGK